MLEKARRWATTQLIRFNATQEKKSHYGELKQNFMPRLPECDVKRLFFESGSTIGYLSYEFLRRMKRPWVRQWIANNDISIHTNNILTYLDFVLADPYADPVECHLRPPASRHILWHYIRQSLDVID